MNSRKGHQGFTSKYAALGNTKLMRVPVSLSQDIKLMLIQLEAIANEHGVDTATEIIDRINDNLAERLP